MKTVSSTNPLLGRRASELQAASQAKSLRGGFLFTALCVGGYLLWLLWGHASVATNGLISEIESIAIPFIGFFWSLKGFRESRSAGWWSANLLSLSQLFYGCGAAIYVYYDLVLHQQPFPSCADAGYILNNFAALAAILLIPHRPLPGVLRFRVLLDSLMLLAALVTFSWFFALGPTLLGGSQSLMGKVLGAAYPILDLATMFCMAILAGISQEPGLRSVRNLICVGATVYVLTDSAYLYQSLKGTYEAGHALDAGWFLANLLYAMAALNLRKVKPISLAVATPKSRAEVGVRAPSLAQMLLPYALVPAVGALDLYVWHEKVSGSIAAGVYVGSGVLLALILARQIFAIAENNRLYRFLQDAYRELEGLATTDGMTGLWNHRAFHEQLRQELTASAENGTTVALFMIDVDHFKSYNDSFGHPAGDEALRIVSRLLRANVRQDDVPARYGGEEFAVILPDTDAEQAFAIAERVREVCEAESFPRRAVTLSIGIVVSNGHDADMMIDRADQALYAAKRNGRNQVVVDGPLPVRLQKAA